MREEDLHQTLADLMQAVGPATAYFAQQLVQSALRDAWHRSLQLLDYGRSFTPVRVERAALRLIQYGVEDVDALRLLLEHDLDTLVGRTDVTFDGQLLFPFAKAH
jgi:hypothetical protein